MKFIVRSGSIQFKGLFFRKAMSHSIAWTSFEAAAAFFDSVEEAKDKMESCGIKNYEMIEALPAPGNPMFRHYFGMLVTPQS